MDIKTLILLPPAAFLIMLAVSWLMSYLSKPLAFKRKGPEGALRKAYASGEDVKQHRVQPDYGQFFPFAFFFTILHVVALIAATAQTGTAGALAVALLYVAGAMLGLFILFRG